MVTASKNTVHSVFFLILDFISISCLFIMIGAEFLGMIMLIVYVGAVAVLFLFVVMMLNIDDVLRTSKFNKMAPFALFIGLIVVAELITLIWFRSDQFSIISVATGVLDSGVSNTVLLGTTLFTDYLYLFEITNIEIGPDHFFFFCLLLSLEVFLIVGGCMLCAYTSPASAETKSAGRRRNPYGDAPGRLRRSAGDRTGGVGRTGAVENGFAGMRQPATSGSAGLRRVDAPLNEQGTTTLIAEKNNDDGTAIEVYSEDEYEETVADDEDDYMSPNGDIADNSDFDSEEDWMSARGEDDYDPVDHIDYSIYGDV